jgi:PAS domain S-box-containing protein
MSRQAKIYIACVIATGAAALGNGLFQWQPHGLVRFFCYLALAVPASCLKVRLPGITGTMSMLFVFLLAGIVDLSLPETLLMAVVCVIVQSLWHPKVRPRAIQLWFSAANMSSAVWISHFVYHLLAGVAPFLEAPFRLSIGAAAFFVANTFPVAAVVALTERKPLRQVWSSCYFWSFAYYLVGAAIVGVFSFAHRMFDWQVSLLILPVVYIIYRSYDLYLGQLQVERKQAEEERKHAEEVALLHTRAMDALASAMAANAMLDAANQASPLAILTLDRQGRVTSWNKMAEHILGWSAEEAIGRPLPLAQGMAEETFHSIIAKTMLGEMVTGTEMKQWRRDGSPFEAAVWTAPLHETADETSGILITVADVSDRTRLEEQLRLSQKMEAVGRLAGGIAHDFNNLLTVINGYSGMLVDTLKGNPYAVSQAGEILSAGERAAELVSQLLTFSRRQMIKPKPIEINQLIHNVERMLRRIIGEHIEFQTELRPETGWIHADPNQIEAMLLNLATNAQDAMSQGGILSIETAAVEVADGWQMDRLELPPGSYVRLVVRDTGHGMDAETQQHIFEPFFTTKQMGRGTGLGLSSVYGTVQQSGGRIFVSSRVGEGTTLSIYLPRIEIVPTHETKRTVSGDSNPGSENILLVEDESSVRHMLREALQKAGYQVWEAANGAEAMGQWGARIGEIDLVVTDIVMPVMNGLRLAEELRSRRPEIKVVFMSGHSMELINNQSLPDPAPDLLQKPFGPQVLVRKVREVLDQVRIPLAPQPENARTKGKVNPFRHSLVR